MTEWRKTLGKVVELCPPGFFSLGKYQSGSRSAVLVNVHLRGLGGGGAGHIFGLRGIVVIGGKALVKHPSLAAQIYRLVMGKGQYLTYESGLEGVLEKMAAFTDRVVLTRRRVEGDDTPDLPHALHHLLNMPTPNLHIQQVKTGEWDNICSQMTLAAMFGVAWTAKKEGGSSSKSAIKAVFQVVGSSSSGCSSVLNDIADMVGAGDAESSGDDATPAAIALRTIAPRRGGGIARGPVAEEGQAVQVHFRKAGVLVTKAQELAMRPDFSLDLLQIPRDCKHMRRVVTAVLCTTCKVGVKEACLSCHVACIACKSFSSTTENPDLDRHLPPQGGESGVSKVSKEFRNSFETPKDPISPPPLPPGTAADATAAAPAAKPVLGDALDDAEDAEDRSILTVADADWDCEILTAADGEAAKMSTGAAPWRKKKEKNTPMSSAIGTAGSPTIRGRRRSGCGFAKRCAQARVAKWTTGLTCR